MQDADCHVPVKMQWHPACQRDHQFWWLCNGDNQISDLPLQLKCVTNRPQHCWHDKSSLHLFQSSVWCWLLLLIPKCTEDPSQAHLVACDHLLWVIASVCCVSNQHNLEFFNNFLLLIFVIGAVQSCFQVNPFNCEFFSTASQNLQLWLWMAEVQTVLKWWC